MAGHAIFGIGDQTAIVFYLPDHDPGLCASVP